MWIRRYLWNREKLVCGLRQSLQCSTKHWKYGRHDTGFLTSFHHPGWKELENCMLCIQPDHMHRGWKLVVGRGSAHCFCCRGHGIANGNGDNRDAHLGVWRAANNTREVQRDQAGRELEESYARLMVLQNVFHWLFERLTKKMKYKTGQR